MRRSWVAVAVVAALSAWAPPSAASRTPPRTFLLSDGVAEDGAVVLFEIQPERHDLRLGHSVAWTNAGILPHELEERDELFRWGPIAPGDT
ncbi:MAG TPA: hypothetical protein VG709_02090, partial [Actinomycetota bacterium]|nr:hypothetical protein [Actinomycetota bacterium]